MKNHFLQSGFSLVETLVAITILLLVIIGPLSITTSAVRSTSFSNEQVIAFFLAQEGVELAQKARDDIFLDYYFMGTPANPWDSLFTDTAGTYGVCFGSFGCGLESNNAVNAAAGNLLTPLNCSSVSCLIYLTPPPTTNVRSKYTYISGSPQTPYTRRIRFVSINANEIKVTSTVTWRTGSLRQEQSVVAETHLFNTIK